MKQSPFNSRSLKTGKSSMLRALSLILSQHEELGQSKLALGRSAILALWRIPYKLNSQNITMRLRERNGRLHFRTAPCNDNEMDNVLKRLKSRSMSQVTPKSWRTRSSFHIENIPIQWLFLSFTNPSLIIQNWSKYSISKSLLMDQVYHVKLAEKDSCSLLEIVWIRFHWFAIISSWSHWNVFSNGTKFQILSLSVIGSEGPQLCIAWECVSQVSLKASR